ncbi:membrane protein FAM174A [Orussus abietinus]|uniref:membrane protein FAM174A n=1 Tax=Orussus abietinus TaxID=222816 RepID=UPI000626A423|nr:membrane protein FAM174A [Orussus abietinus]
MRRPRTLKLLVYYVMVFYVCLGTCDESFKKSRTADSAPADVSPKTAGADLANKPEDPSKLDEEKRPHGANDKHVTSNHNLTSAGEINNDTSSKTIVPPAQPGAGHATSLNPGALWRGFYVFLGLSVLVMSYIIFRSFRITKSRAQMVRKYGVLAHRQDVEMRPLPLDEEDDDDTTVFDASNVSPRMAQHQNS